MNALTHPSGLAGLVASIACAEAGADVHLLEAHGALGGRVRCGPPPFVAHQGPHVLYDDGLLWAWLAARGLVGRRRPPRWGPWPPRACAGRGSCAACRRPACCACSPARDVPPRGPRLPRLGRGVRRRGGGARAAANLMGVVTFDADPGRLSAAFVWERMVRVFGSFPPAARYVIGGWGGLVARMAAYAGWA